MTYSRLVKEGGQIGIIVPGVQQEFIHGVPEHLVPYWQLGFNSFHSPAWWHHHWQKSGAVENIVSDFLPEGWQQWLRFQEVCCEHGSVPEAFRDWVVKEIKMLRTDAGRTLGFSRILAHRKANV